MASFLHEESGIEYTTGKLVFAFVVLILLGWIAAGAIAAVPALFGAVEAAMWVWGLLGGIWSGNLIIAIVKYKRGSKRISR